MARRAYGVKSYDKKGIWSKAIGEGVFLNFITIFSVNINAKTNPKTSILKLR